MKKTMSLVLIMLLVLGVLSACASKQEASSGNKTNNSSSAKTSDSSDQNSDFPNKPVSIIVAYSAGGGTDTTARSLAPFLEEELGVSVNVINKPGGSGWVGWTALANAKPDGYTIGYLNSPNIASGLVNPNIDHNGVNLDSFTMLANDVTDPGCIAIRVDDDRFSNLKEFVKYARKHELTTTATGVGGDDDIAMLKINKKLGTKLRPIQFQGTADSRSAFLGGHVDVLVTSVGEAYTLAQNGQIKVLAVMDDERSQFLPDVPTLKEAGYKAVYSQSTRGLATQKGVDAERVQILRDALKKAITNQDHVQKLKDVGIDADYANGKEYRKMLEADKKDVQDLKKLLGW